MKVLITGSNGFIAKNLSAHLLTRTDIDILQYSRNDSASSLERMLNSVDFVFHLAGVNRPKNNETFSTNADITQLICTAIIKSGRKIPILFTSSTQALLDNEYGLSKLRAEKMLIKFSQEYDVPVHIFRLPNVFGKWARPNYNSAVATFCNNIAHDLPIHVNDPSAAITLVYIDDVISRFIAVMDKMLLGTPYIEVAPTYQTTVGDLASLLRSFKESRKSLVTEPVGTGLARALYSTYLSYIPPINFTYEIPKHGDARGVFVEMLKTQNSGQFSYFTAHPGITRGGHYHHSKTEKFLVIKGSACFRFRHITSGDFYQLFTCGEKPEVVETVPGWSHDITNIGDDELIVMLWANEVFDREHPDTFMMPVGTES